MGVNYNGEFSPISPAVDVVEGNMKEKRELTNLERFVKEVIASINSGEYFKKFGHQIDEEVELAEKMRQASKDDAVAVEEGK